MKLDVNLSALEKALKSIGGSKTKIEHLRHNNKLADPLEDILLTEGEVQIDGSKDFENLGNIGGTIAIGNTQVSLHILHPNEDKEPLSLIPAGKTRYHIAECKTLDTMRAGGRFDRYIAGNRLDGLFTVTPYDQITKIRGDKMELN